MVKLISVTSLSAYTFCQRALYLRLVLGFKEPTKPVMLLGSIRHKVYDEANIKEEHLVSMVTSDMSRQEVLQMFANAYNGVLNKSIYAYASQLDTLKMDKNETAEQMRPLVLVQAHARADEILSFSAKMNLFGKELWDKLTPKIMTELRVSSDKLRLKGIVDRIEIHDNEYVPVEIKTGRVPSEGVWPDHRLQVASYMMLLKEKFNVEVREGLVKYVKTDQTRQITFNPFMEHEVTTMVDNVFQLMERNDIPAFCGKSYCSVCALGDSYEKHLIKVAAR